MVHLAALIKPVLLVIAGKSFAITLSAPNAPAEKKVRDNFFESNVHYITKVVKVSPYYYEDISLTNEQTIFWANIVIDIVVSGQLGLQLTSTAISEISAHIVSFAHQHVTKRSGLCAAQLIHITSLLHHPPRAVRRRPHVVL